MQKLRIKPKENNKKTAKMQTSKRILREKTRIKQARQAAESPLVIQNLLCL